MDEAAGIFLLVLLEKEIMFEVTSISSSDDMDIRVEISERVGMDCFHPKQRSRRSTSLDADTRLMTDFFYQDPGSLIRGRKEGEGVLKILLFSLKKFKEALIRFYVDRDADSFDPHVGDTCCQVRAYSLLQLSKKTLSPESLRCKLASLKQKVDLVERGIQSGLLYEFILQSKPSISHLVEYLGPLELINADDWFLFCCYFLTEFKTETSYKDTRIDYNYTSLSMGASRKASKKLIRHYQRLLSKKSCDHILSWSSEIYKDDKENNILRLLLKEDLDGRSVMPCFFGSKIIFDHICASNQCVLFEVNRINEGFSRKSLIIVKKGVSFLFKGASKNPTETCLLIKGETDSKEHFVSEDTLLDSFNRYGAFSILMANMSSHPQYTGRSLNIFKENPFCGIASNAYEDEKNMLDFFRNMSKEIGCCHEKRTLFFARHICLGSLLKSEKETDIPPP